MYTKEKDINDKVSKIKSVEDYIKKVQELQEFYESVYFNINFKELSLALIEKYYEYDEFKIEFNNFINNLKKINELATKVKENLPSDKVNLIIYVISNSFKDIITVNINDFISTINEIDSDFGKKVTDFYTANSKLVEDVIQFYNDNKEFLQKYFNEVLNIIYSTNYKEKQLEYFFRGQSDQQYGLLSSVYRGNLKENE